MYLAFKKFQYKQYNMSKKVNIRDDAIMIMLMQLQLKLKKTAEITYLESKKQQRRYRVTYLEDSK